jgi:predicted NBD/HSP70 family sugar kinase
LEQRYPVPVYVENDVNLLAIIEVLEGRLTGSTNSITLKLDYGIGGAVVIGRQLYDGSSHVAGEFGHYKAFRGEYAHPCHCGSYGCLTTLASVSGLRNNARLSLEEFNDRLRSGEESANRLFNEIQEAVGLSLSNIVTFLNPDHVLLTGKMVSVLGDLLVPAIERRLFSTIPESCKELQLLHVPEPVDEPALSAALVKYHFFDIPLESLSL